MGIFHRISDDEFIEMLKEPLSPDLKALIDQCRGDFVARAIREFDSSVEPLVRALHVRQVADARAQKKDKTAAAPPADD